MYCLLFILLTFISSSAWADSPDTHNFLFVVGGSGDPAGDSTIFDTEIASIGPLAKSSAWSTTLLYDGDRSGSKAAAKNAFGQDAKTFTQQNFSAAIQQYETLLQEKKIKAGDEFLLVVDTHGAQHDPKELSHSVVSEDEALLPLDQIQTLRDHLQAAGAKVAIIDLSCFSGSTQALANDNTCVIASTDKDMFGYGLTSPIDLFQPGNNLEQNFISMRMKDQSAQFPNISTFAGKKTTEFLHALVPSTYAFTGDEGINDYYFTEMMKQTSCQDVRDKEMDDLNKLFSSFNAMDLYLRSMIGIDQLEAATKTYGETMQGLRNTYNQVAKYEERQEMIGSDPNPYTWGQIARMVSSGYMKEREAYLKQKISDPSTTKEDLADDQDRLQNDYKIEEAYQRLQSVPEFQSMQNMESNYDKHLKDLWPAAYQVAYYEKQIYRYLYEEQSSKCSSPNPCVNFSL